MEEKNLRFSQGEKYLPHALLLLTAVIFGGTFAAGRIASEGAGPFTVSLFRFLLSLIVLLPRLIASEGLKLRSVPPSAWILLVLSGLAGLVLYNFFFIKGLTLTEAGRASVIVVVNPVFIYLGSVLFFKEKLSFIRVLGMLLAVFGMLLVISSGNPLNLLKGDFNRGDIILLGCVVSWTAYSLMGKLLMGKVSPLFANTWSTIFAIILIIPLLLSSNEPFFGFLSFSLKTWAAVAFLGVFGTALGFTFFYRGILSLGPHKAAAYITLVPFFGLLSGALLLGETAGASVFAGLMISLIGLALVQKY
jgi:drug/metabolite transporter (DMT)-like permease